MKTIVKWLARFFLFNIGWTVVWSQMAESDHGVWARTYITFGSAFLFVACIELLGRAENR